MGIVKTNSGLLGKRQSNNNYGDIPDLPSRLNSISAKGQTGRVNLTLGYTDYNNLDGIQVNYKTSGYPISPDDGMLVRDTAKTTLTIENLPEDTSYYIRVFPYRIVDGIYYYQTDPINSKAYVVTNAGYVSFNTTFESTNISTAKISGGYWNVDERRIEI